MIGLVIADEALEDLLEGFVEIYYGFDFFYWLGLFFLVYY